jgi:hypothetical protein
MQKFGSCCKDLYEAMIVPPQTFFRIEENEVLYLTIGYTQTDECVGWLDQAIIFCPFCGVQIQDREEIKNKSHVDNVSDAVS